MKNFKFLSLIVVFLSVGIISCGDELSDSALTPDVSIENFISDVIGDEEISASTRSRNRGKCFELVFPVSITFEDGSTATYDDKETMHDALKEYKEANPEAERPNLVFPVTVIDRDGNETVLESQEDLRALKSECRGDGGNGGKGGNHCYQLVYPVSVEFEDGTTATYDDKAAMKEALRAYKEANSEAEKPSLVFPLTVVDRDGNESVANSQEDLRALKVECHGGDRGGKKCFQLVYPLTIEFEDGTTATYEDKASMKMALREYKEANPEAAKPSLVFPVTVVDRDDNETIVSSQEEMDALKEACREERG